MAQQTQQPSVGGTGQQSQFQSVPQVSGVGQQAGVETGQRMGQFASPSLRQYEKSMPSEFRVALHDFNTLAEVADWCRDQCLDKGPQLSTVVRTCEDLRDLAATNEKLITHDSEYGPHVAESFLKVAQQSLQELQQFQQEPAVADTIPVVQRAIESTEKLLNSVGWQSQQVGQQIGQQWQTQQKGTRFGSQKAQVGQQQSRQVGQQQYGRQRQQQYGPQQHAGAQQQVSPQQQTGPQRQYGRSPESRQQF
jgi:hypothetical protein